MQKPMGPPMGAPSNGGGNVANYGAGMVPNIKNVGPQVKKSGVNPPTGDKGKNNDKRNYDKPWLLPEKKEPQTFFEFCYPDGAGPDAELI